jgi:hypothetical protein
VTRWERFWHWLRLRWKAVGAAILLVVGVLVSVKFVRAVIAYIKQPRRWKIVPDDPESILIRDGKEYVQVKLPKGITIDEVAGAGISEEGEWAVELKHTPTDRTGATSGGGSKLDL